jgi:hypothetical protein
MSLNHGNQSQKEGQLNILNSRATHNHDVFRSRHTAYEHNMSTTAYNIDPGVGLSQSQRLLTPTCAICPLHTIRCMPEALDPVKTKGITKIQTPAMGHSRTSRWIETPPTQQAASTTDSLSHQGQNKSPSGISRALWDMKSELRNYPKVS